MEDHGPAISESTTCLCRDAMLSLIVGADQNAKLQDLDSRNGIEVNGGPTKTLMLHLGDEFRLGAVRLSVQMKSTSAFVLQGTDEEPTKGYQKSDNQQTIRIDEAVLTPAQLHVLDLAAEGLSEKEIADKMHCTYSTIHTHFKAIYKKLDVHTRAELQIKMLKMQQQKKS